MASQFSKKTSGILMVLSIFGLIVGTALILFSNDLFQFMFSFAENVLHRSLNPEKWRDTFYSFALIPVFIVIMVNAIIFLKYNTKTKIFLLSAFLVTIIFMIIMIHTKAANIVNSDLAGEMMLWRECLLAKSFIPKTWFYSTEIRILNTQIFGAIFFALFSDWTLIKLLVSICSLIVLFFATLFLLDKIGIKEFWKKFTCAILVITPSSGWVLSMMTFGNYYIPTAVISFLYIGLFIDLQNNDVKSKKAKAIIYILLAFFAGLTSIKYILMIIFPLAFFMICSNLIKTDISKFDTKEFFIKNKLVFFSTTGLFSGGIGYIGNSLLHKFYSFSEYNSMRFGYLKDSKIFEIFSTLMEIFGYNENISVLTPNGITNIFVCIAIVLFISMLFEIRKIEMPINQKIILGFFTVNFIFNTFIFLTVDFGSWLYMPIIVYIIPCAFVCIFNTSINKIKRFSLGVTISVVFLVSSFTVAQKAINQGETHRTKVAKFLEQNYTFGYATFWNADITTFLTNGKVDVGAIKNSSSKELHNIPVKYEVYEWLTSKRYYEKDFKNEEKIFLLVTEDEFSGNRDKQIFASGTQVYKDDFFRVFEYENHDAFRYGF